MFRRNLIGAGSSQKAGLGRKLALAAASTVLSLICVVLFCKGYAAGLGIRDPDFRYEKQLGMWQPDDRIGYRNQIHFDTYCFGNIHVTTNEHGFRGHVPTKREKPAGVVRVFGLGDSVMWGTSVNEEDSFLGILRARLAGESAQYEVINAGVVGYSTLQELTYLERYIIPFGPDIVLINFCPNDPFPTADPFDNGRDVLIDYLNEYLEDQQRGLTDRERYIAGRIRDALRSGRRLRLSAAPDVQRLALNLFLERPVDRMVQLARSHRFRLIYLLIPPRDPTRADVTIATAFRRRLDELEAEYLDLGLLLTDNSRPEPPAEDSWIQRAIRETPLRDLSNIMLLKHLDVVHRTCNYIDFVHPTRRGNRIIAEQIHRHLMQTD